MTRVLFVDDDQGILDGLRDMLRRERKRWEMVFAPSGAAALEELQRVPFDVVVSDMRMPGMDGATLLAKVKEGWPATARIILSGHAERDAVMRVLPIAHQFLGKPCTGDSLRSVIERTCAVQAILMNEELRGFVRNLDKLPSPPTTYFEMSRALGDPDIETADIAKIVERDPAMSAKVLQLVNSAYFGVARKLTSVATAVPYLGFELLKNLSLSVQIFSAMDGQTIEGFSAEELQRQSLLTGRLAKKLCTDKIDGEDAFTAGLLHDIGKIVLAIGRPKRFQEALKKAATSGQPLHLAEREVMGFTHAEVGAYLLGGWGLPHPFIEVTALHHSLETMLDAPFGPLAAVHIADALIHGAIEGTREESKLLNAELVAKLGVADQLEGWRGLAAAEVALSQARA